MLTTETRPKEKKHPVPVSKELAEEARKWDKPREEPKPDRPTIATTGLRSVRFDLD